MNQEISLRFGKGTPSGREQRPGAFRSRHQEDEMSDKETPMPTEPEPFSETQSVMAALCVEAWAESEVPNELEEGVRVNFQRETPRVGPHRTLEDQDEWTSWLERLLTDFPLPQESVEDFRELTAQKPGKDLLLEAAQSKIYSHLTTPGE
jgi:hypothetical protein